MDCTDVAALTTDHLDGALTGARRRAFERHLAECRTCTSHVEAVRRTVATVARLRASDPPPSSYRRVLRAFRAWKRSGKPPT